MAENKNFPDISSSSNESTSFSTAEEEVNLASNNREILEDSLSSSSLLLLHKQLIDDLVKENRALVIKNEEQNKLLMQRFAEIVKLKGFESKCEIFERQIALLEEQIASKEDCRNEIERLKIQLEEQDNNIFEKICINEELEQKILILNEKLEKMRNSSSNNSSRQVPHSTTSNTAKPQLDPKNPFSNMKEKAENKKQPNFWIEGFQQEINDKDKYIDSLELQIEELSEQVKNLTVKLRKSQKDAIRANSSNIQKGQSQI